jgi:hypothetical protein
MVNPLFRYLIQVFLGQSAPKYAEKTKSRSRTNEAKIEESTGLVQGTTE